MTQIARVTTSFKHGKILVEKSRPPWDTEVPLCRLFSPAARKGLKDTNKAKTSELTCSRFLQTKSVNPLHAAGKKSRQCRTSSSHGGQENSTEKHQPVSEGISWELCIVSSHTAPQKIAKKISFEVTENDMVVAEQV